MFLEHREGTFSDEIDNSGERFDAVGIFRGRIIPGRGKNLSQKHIDE